MIFRLIICGVILPTTLLAGQFQAPPGCETYMTVQARGCEVSHYYRCDREPEGHQHRVDFGINGKTYESMIDSEARWLQSFSYGNQIGDTLDEGAPDSASLTGLLATGRDDYEFFLTDSTGVRTRLSGYDALTGEVVTIDGQDLKRTEFFFEEHAMSGELIRRITGNEYVLERERTFIGGTGYIELGSGEGFPIDGTPRDFIFPGEPGFGATVPLYECRDMMSQLDLLPWVDHAKG